MAPPTLLSLPPEIRLQIWEYSLTSPTRLLKYDAHRKRFDVSKIGAGLLTVSHLVAAETYYLPLQLNTLVLRVPRRFAGPIILTPQYAPEVEMLLSRLHTLEQEAGCVFKIKYDIEPKPMYEFDPDCYLDFRVGSDDDGHGFVDFDGLYRSQ